MGKGFWKSEEMKESKSPEDSVPAVSAVRLTLDPYWYIMTFGDMKDVA